MFKFSDTLTKGDYLKWAILIIVSLFCWLLVLYQFLQPSPWDFSVRELEKSTIQP